MTDAAPRTGLAALAEALRAPLLLSPAADVYAGWLLVLLGSSSGTREGSGAARWLGVPEGGWPLLGAAAASGCLLLAAGMAQNAVVDREEDAARKPDRPIPRGGVGVGWVRMAWVVGSLAGLAAALPLAHGATAALAIVAGTSLYHLGLKRRRVAGCVVLGLLRGACMGLGVLAARTLIDRGAQGADLGPAFAGCGLYALYIFGAALHASTDDEPSPGAASPVGLTLCGLVLALWGILAFARLAGGAGWHAGLGAALAAAALLRLVHARHQLPPPAVTGVALSGLHLHHAVVASVVAGPLAAAVMLALFAASRALLRIYPPS